MTKYLSFFMSNNVKNLHKRVCDLCKMRALFCDVLVLFLFFIFFISVNNFLTNEYWTLCHDN